MAGDNKSLGRFHLDGIPAAPRGVPQIEVTFDIDANGIVNVSAKDKGTGKQQQIRIEASSGLSEEDIKRMKAEAEANREADAKAKEQIDKVNHADSMIFQTEKQLKEYGDKIPADKKSAIESALTAAREALASKDVAKIDSTQAALNTAWQAASEEIYKAAQAAGGAGSAGGAGVPPGFEGFGGGAGGSAGGAGASDGSASGDGGAGGAGSAGGGATDVEFEEVK
jgi:molecular chaperone DnaK